MKTLRSMSPKSYPQPATAPATSCDTVDTPCGPVSFSIEGDEVVEVRLGRRRTRRGDGKLLRKTRRQLEDYFAGRRRSFDLPVRLRGRSFTLEVLAAVSDIPYGETRTYGETAKEIGSPGAARAAGQAVGANPVPLLIPCHRVLAAGGRLGGFGCGLRWKRFLLDLEGVEYRD